MSSLVRPSIWLFSQALLGQGSRNLQRVMILHVTDRMVQSGFESPQSTAFRCLPRWEGIGPETTLRRSPRLPVALIHVA